MFEERYNEKLKPFKHLWNFEDEGWLNQRKIDWKVILNDIKTSKKKYSASELKVMATYFLKGEYSGYFAPELLFLFTPIKSKKQACDFFYSGVFDTNGRDRIFTSYISIASREFSELFPWVKDHIRYFIEGVLGDDCKAFNHKNSCDYLANTPVWADIYYMMAKKILNKRVDLQYHGAIDCFDFFLSTLAICSDKNYRKYMKFDVLYELVDDVLNDDSSSELQIAFATKFKDNKQQILEDWALNSHLDTGQ